VASVVTAPPPAESVCGRSAEITMSPNLCALASPASYYDVELHRTEDLDAVVAWSTGNGMRVLAAAERRFRVHATELHARALSELMAVASLREWTPPSAIPPDHVARLAWGRRARRLAS
jgi:hypothetical protein